MIKNFRKIILDNGMTLLFEKRTLPVASLGFGVRAGSNIESLKEKGILHFIEHMLFKGTLSRTALQIAKEIEKNGGQINGFTSEEITGYWCKIPSDQFFVGLDVLTDLIKNPLFDQQEIEKEREVILEEIKLYHDNPYFYVFDEIQKSLYTGTLSENTIGTISSINSINRQKLLQKFRKIYTPNNLILCVVGNTNFEDVIKFCKKNFGNERSFIKTKLFGLKNEQKIEKRKGIGQANLVFAYHVPIAQDKKCYAAKVLNCLMTEGFSSKLFIEIREKRNLAYAVKGESNINRDFAYNLIYVGTMKEKIDEVKRIILEEFKKIKYLTEKELNEVKKQLIGNYKISLEDSQEQMINLISYEVCDKAEEFYNYEENIKSVSLKDVKELASKVVERYSFFVLVPE